MIHRDRFNPWGFIPHRLQRMLLVLMGIQIPRFHEVKVELKREGLLRGCLFFSVLNLTYNLNIVYAYFQYDNLYERLPNRKFH